MATGTVCVPEVHLKDAKAAISHWKQSFWEIWRIWKICFRWNFEKICDFEWNIGIFLIFQQKKVLRLSRKTFCKKYFQNLRMNKYLVRIHKNPCQTMVIHWIFNDFPKSLQLWEVTTLWCQLWECWDILSLSTARDTLISGGVTAGEPRDATRNRPTRWVRFAFWSIWPNRRCAPP